MQIKQRTLLWFSVVLTLGCGSSDEGSVGDANESGPNSDAGSASDSDKTTPRGLDASAGDSAKTGTTGGGSGV